MNDIKIPINASTYVTAEQYLPKEWFDQLYIAIDDNGVRRYYVNGLRFHRATKDQMLISAIELKYRKFNIVPYLIVGVTLLLTAVCGYVIFDDSPVYIGFVSICLFSLFNYQTSENIQNFRYRSKAHDALLETMYTISDYKIAKIQTNGCVSADKQIQLSTLSNAINLIKNNLGDNHANSTSRYTR